MIKRIGGRREERGKKKRPQKRPLPVPFQKRRIDPPQFGHERERQWHFKNQAEDNEEPQRESHVTGNRQLRDKPRFDAVGNQKVQGKRQHEEETESQPQIKSHGTRQDERRHKSALLHVQAGNHEGPNFPQDIGCGEHQSKQGRYFEVLP